MNITPIEVLSAAEIHVRVWAPIKSKKINEKSKHVRLPCDKASSQTFRLVKQILKMEKVTVLPQPPHFRSSSMRLFFSKTPKLPSLRGLPIKVRHLSQRENITY